MDLNVCSRRVHDGYATIRSRGRSRPRAVYRSDSEELLKEAGGPYALPRVSNTSLAPELVQVPRWSDTGRNKLLENYGTLRKAEKSSEVCIQNEKSEKIVLNTFSSSKSQLNRDLGNKINGKDVNERLYDTVPPEDPQERGIIYQGDDKMTKIVSGNDKNAFIIQSEIVETLNNLYDTVTDEKLKKISKRRSDNVRCKTEGNYEENSKIDGTKASRQPIYAVPNVPKSNGDNKFDCRLSTDGNYVPSGDLYRTTARYIEDINRNIAEIDKSYDELRCSSTSNTRNSAYGVINKIPRSNDSSIEQNNDEHLYTGFHRKRDTLAPMPPISPNFGENFNDDRTSATPIFTKNDREFDNNQGTRFDFKIPRNPSKESSRESVRIRPNSYGKLPPKLLPRSSSIENNSSRHSTGSTATSSSTKSTESLYAISETLTELPRHQSIPQNLQSPRRDRNFEYTKKSNSYDSNSVFSDLFVPMRSSRSRVKVNNQQTIKPRGNSQQRTQEDELRRICQQDRFQMGSIIRRNRSCGRTEDLDTLSNYSEFNNKGNCISNSTSSNTLLDSTTLREKDQSLYYVSLPAADSNADTTNTNPGDSQSRSSRRERIVDLEIQSSTNDESTKKGKRSKNENSTTTDRAPVAGRSNRDRSRTSLTNSTGTIRRNRCSSRVDEKVDDYDDDNDYIDDEMSLIDEKSSDRKPKIYTSTNSASQVQFCPNDEFKSECSLKSNSHQVQMDNVKNFYHERKYGTLPYKRSKNSTRPLHKSSEDVLDGERISRSNEGALQRSCISTLDVRAQGEVARDGRMKNGSTKDRLNGAVDFVPFYLMDATEVILKGQLERTIREDRFIRPEELDTNQMGSSTLQTSPSPFSDEIETSNLELRIDRVPNRFSTCMSRTRHNSLESDEVDPGKRSNSPICIGNGMSAGGFATLPRRGNISKDQRISDTPRRLSGNVPILEPLYEHAVSDPVKPRGNDNNVIPWWELATRKYRHRSCPALQAHVVSAFEQSLSNMTQRLQQLTATAEKKDSELQELRDTIERLRKQSAEAGLNGAASNGRRHTLGDSDSGTTGCTGYSNHQGSSIARQLSADSVTSLNSLSSACSASSHHKKKGWLRSSFSKAFSRSRKNRHGSVSDAEDCKDGPTGDLSAPNSPRLPTAAKHENSHNHNQNSKTNGQKSPEHENSMTGSKSSSALYKKDDEDVDELKKQLREKDMVLTDIRLEALSSAHQLESLKDTVIKMRNEMLNLKQNNERLQRLVTSKSLTSSQSSLPSDPERRFSMTEVASSVAALSNGDHHTTNSDQMEDLNVPEHPVAPANTTATNEPVIEQDTDGKRINVAVYLGSEKSFNVNLVSGNNDGGVCEPAHCVIASVCISNKTSWDALDNTVRRCFKDYVSRVDPVTNLGLGVECVAAYHLGEASRFTTDSQHPELLPCGYLIGHVKTIYLVLSGYSWLAVDTLIPRSIVQRLVSLLTEHRRVILCGPSGTGKSYLAGKLAHALVDSDAEVKDAAAVATFNVDHKSSKELRQYLAHIAERCDSNAADELPKVIILENLQHAASLGELFSGLLGTRHSSCPAIIGTMSQATCSTTNLQLHHNFRWVLCANHMEPVKGFLGRYLRRKLLEHELRETVGPRNAEMAAVVEWLPRVWLHLNKFLETHSSSDVTIGPRLFLSCPMEVAGSQVWFTDLWNYSVIPYLVEAVREGLTLYGRRVSGNGNGDSAWEDPAQFITTSYPWISTHAVHGGSDALLRLRPEDVGYDVVSSGHNSGVGASSVKSLGSTHSDTEGDPLLNMLMRLQEAANYSSPHSNDSDSVTSMDSSHTRHSEDLSTSTTSSRGVESAL